MPASAVHNADGTYTISYDASDAGFYIAMVVFKNDAGSFVFGGQLASGAMITSFEVSETVISPENSYMYGVCDEGSATEPLNSNAVDCVERDSATGGKESYTQTGTVTYTVVTRGWNSGDSKTLDNLIDLSNGGQSLFVSYLCKFGTAADYTSCVFPCRS